MPNFIRLNREIVVKYNANAGKTDDNANPLPEVWQSLVTLAASKQGLSGRTYYQAATTDSQSDVIYKIRFHPDIKPGMLISDDGHNYRITAVIDKDGYKMWLEIHASEVLPSAG
jgi:SPP1 family predicted phage head-tail adaptor